MPVLYCTENVHFFFFSSYVGNKLAVGHFIHGGETWMYKEIRDLLKERYADIHEYTLLFESVRFSLSLLPSSLYNSF